MLSKEELKVELAGIDEAMQWFFAEEAETLGMYRSG
jgi:hypothetical protein